MKKTQKLLPFLLVVGLALSLSTCKRETPRPATIIKGCLTLFGSVYSCSSVAACGDCLFDFNEECLGCTTTGELACASFSSGYTYNCPDEATCYECIEESNCSGCTFTGLFYCPGDDFGFYKCPDEEVCANCNDEGECSECLNLGFFCNDSEYGLYNCPSEAACESCDGDDECSECKNIGFFCEDSEYGLYSY